MSTDNGNDAHHKPSPQTVILLLGSIADTTWRMFVPALTGIVAGYYTDSSLDTKPWFFIAGTISGCVVAGWLVVRQFRSLSESNTK